MIKITVDFNVVLDFLNRRQDHANAASLIDLCARRQVRGYLAAHEVTTLAYFFMQEHGKSTHVKKILVDLLGIFSILPINETLLKSALESPLEDFEDAVVDECSKKESVDYIVTNNLKDFRKSRVKAVSTREFLSKANL